MEPEGGSTPDPFCGNGLARGGVGHENAGGVWHAVLTLGDHLGSCHMAVICPQPLRGHLGLKVSHSSRVHWCVYTVFLDGIPTGEGSLPQAHTVNEVQGKQVARQQALAARKRGLSGVPQRMLAANPRCEPDFHVHTINLVADSRLLLTAQGPGTFIFPAAFYLSLFAVLKVTEVGKLFISYTAPVIIHQEFG